MNYTRTYQDIICDPDLFGKKFISNLSKVDRNFPSMVSFELKIQKDNLMNLVNEANERIQKYEHIYPFIKEMCSNQTIDPHWYSYIKKVLEWALSKGRGSRSGLSKELKTAWLTYIVLLSLTMIDEKKESRNPSLKFLKTDPRSLRYFMENN